MPAHAQRMSSLLGADKEFAYWAGSVFPSENHYFSLRKDKKDKDACPCHSVRVIACHIIACHSVSYKGEKRMTSLLFPQKRQERQGRVSVS